ncbi:MAG: 50S ribosomal protein L21 [candidate division Zixibacteria bacterium]|nr:50S ribosomal protein L21 [candidate division Zixibacteria bacterium]
MEDKMYAVFQLAGFQYTVEEGTVLKVPSQNMDDGAKLDIKEVLLIKDGDNSHIGNPFVENAKVEAEVVGKGKSDKVLVYKFKRRTKYRRTEGHRQNYSEIKINRILPPQA